MNEDQKDFLNFGIGAILLGVANIFAFAAMGDLIGVGTESSNIAAWVVGWTLFVVDVMMFLSIWKWADGGGR